MTCKAVDTTLQQQKQSEIYIKWFKLLVINQARDETTKTTKITITIKPKFRARFHLFAETMAKFGDSQTPPS